MKYIFIPILAIMLSGCKDDEEPRQRWAERNIPEEAHIVEYLPAKGTNPRTYIIFELRERCFLLFNGDRRVALANINCPTKTE